MARSPLLRFDVHGRHNAPDGVSWRHNRRTWPMATADWHSVTMMLFHATPYWRRGDHRAASLVPLRWVAEHLVVVAEGHLSPGDLTHAGTSRPQPVSVCAPAGGRHASDSKRAGARGGQAAAARRLKGRRPKICARLPSDRTRQALPRAANGDPHDDVSTSVQLDQARILSEALAAYAGNRRGTIVLNMAASHGRRGFAKVDVAATSLWRGRPSLGGWCTAASRRSRQKMHDAVVKSEFAGPGATITDAATIALSLWCWPARKQSSWSALPQTRGRQGSRSGGTDGNMVTASKATRTMVDHGSHREKW